MAKSVEQRAKGSIGHRAKEIFLLALSPLLFATLLVTPSFAQDVIKVGSIATFDYTLTVNGHTVESSKGLKPVQYMHGQGTIVPGLAKALEGMKAGEEKIVTVPPEDAYGQILKEAIKDVPKANFPEDFEFVLGSIIQLEDEEGNAYPGIIWDIKEEAVAVNFNHPLAGQTLIFEVKVLSIE